MAARRRRVVPAAGLRAGSTPQYVAELIDATSSPRAPWFEQLRRLTIPPQALLVRRMEGLVFTTLGELRAGADWHALASEFFADARPRPSSASRPGALESAEP